MAVILVLLLLLIISVDGIFVGNVYLIFISTDYYYFIYNDSPDSSLERKSIAFQE